MNIMKKHKWKKIIATAITLITSVAGINIYTGNNTAPIQTIPNHHEATLHFNKTYTLEDNTQIQIKTSPVGHWAIFTPIKKDN